MIVDSHSEAIVYARSGRVDAEVARVYRDYFTNRSSNLSYTNFCNIPIRVGSNLALGDFLRDNLRYAVALYCTAKDTLTDLTPYLAPGQVFIELTS